jgi:chromosomal replication initiation ATPase DnaA
MKAIFGIFELLFGKDENFIRQKTNSHEVTQYRFLIMYILINIYHWRITEVQREFNCKAHKTVINAIERVSDWNKYDKSFRSKVELIEFMFK